MNNFQNLTEYAERNLTSSEVTQLVIICASFIGSLGFCASLMVAAIIEKQKLHTFCESSGVMMQIFRTEGLYTLFALAIHKYFSVVMPLKRVITHWRGLVILCLTWTAAILCNIGPVLGWNIMESVPASFVCHAQHPTTILQVTQIGFVLCFTYLCPVIVMSMLYPLMFVYLRRYSLLMKDTGFIGNNGVRAQKHNLVTLVIASISFILAWIPMFFYDTLSLEFKKIKDYSKLLSAAYVCGFSYSALHPVILISRNPRFRRAIQEILKCKYRTNNAFTDLKSSNASTIALRTSNDYFEERRCSVWYMLTQSNLLSLEHEPPQRRLKLRWIETNL
ncbi:adenosine receptor A1-like [Nematostella vectensis]|uniref:adenosine receptor A1-like n=1 Tax=Nematostella vectensis TaxID=45351 RepID=UPI0020779623|nr:adenosine receptor A1-like [Nematostella vectensis]